ncbi:ATP-binding SpoIIE family protein phosphatase [Rarobacter faecitabidus]|uniref:Stage II sporulation protein E n=1 Tax=Rarobacter faecitabidus TaxID=13243 RepID=A0A542ZE72_RARFA|nr:ATP-binding SpoIIE family protein phosphatase [Rarobacter faecitabidus]TQL58633.1 stage II sporulation protein E [Rarobacter faecitabidus]
MTSTDPGREPNAAGEPAAQYSASELRHGLERVLIAGLENLATPVALLEYRRRSSASKAEPTADNLPPECGSLTLVWANSALLLDTDKTVDQILGSTLRDVTGECTFLSGPWEVERALLDGVAINTELRWTQVDSFGIENERAWHLSLTPLRGRTVRAGELWWLQLIEVDRPDVAHPAPSDEVIAERQERRGLALIAEVSNFLIDLERPQVLADISKVIATAMGGWFGFYLPDECRLRYSESLTGAGGEPARDRALRTGSGIDALGDSETPGMGTTVIEGPEITEVQDPVAAIMRGKVTGPTDFLVDGAYLPHTASRDFARDLRARLAAQGRDFGDVVLYPLPGRRGPLGVLAAAMPTVSEETTVFGMSARIKRTTSWGVMLDGVTVLDLVVRRVGMAIENTQLHRREHAVAEALQRAMLPEQVDIAGLDVWSYYAPASSHAQVGGDWFDVLSLAEHTAGFVIGDVVGHDIEAAATMGQLRSVIRAYAFELRDPAVVLSRADHLADEMRLPRSASAVYGTLTRLRQGWKLEYARAGHLPPLWMHGDEVTALDEKGGLLLGYGRANHESHSRILGPGDVLVLYTDGLIERRQTALSDALEGLKARLLQTKGLDAAGIGEELLGILGGAGEDDVALVIVRIPDPNAGGNEGGLAPRIRRWSLPPESASIARARHAVVQACEQWGLGNGANAELVTSELVANAVIHGWGHLSLRALVIGDKVRIEVEDANPSPPVLTAGHANRSGGFGMRIVDRLAQWGYEPTEHGKIVWAEL